MRLGTTAAFAILLALSGGALAQQFPAKPVRMIVAFPPGGGADIVARILAQKLTETWGQQVVVDNRAGAGGVVGTEAAAAAAPDGYTMFLGTLGNLAVNQHLYTGMKIDPLRAFAPVTQVVNVHFALLANPGFPPNNVTELIAYARANPGKVNFSSSGAGGAPHLAGELFKSMAKVDLVHVPYKGSGPSMQDLIGGQVSITFDSLVQALPHIKAGRLKALAVLGKNRSQLLPEVPTVDESGLPGYDLTNWFGMVAPAATPPATLAILHRDIAGALQQAEIRDKFATMGADAVGNSPEAFGAIIRADSRKWAELIKEANIRAE